MVEHWRLRKPGVFVLKVILIYLFYDSEFCCSLNEEGEALLRIKDRLDSDPLRSLVRWRDDDDVVNPCLWDGVECSNGFVVSLNLKDFGLVGTLAPEIGKLIHVKSIILRNNSLYGSVPDEIVKLEKLEVLDLGYNGFRKPLPSTLRNYPVILFDNDELRDSILPEIPSEVEELRNAAETEDSSHHRKLLQRSEDPSAPNRTSPTPSPSPTPSESPTPSPSLSPLSPPISSPPPASSPSPETDNNIVPNVATKSGKGRKRYILIMSVAIGGSLLLLVLGVSLFYYRANKVSRVKPRNTTLTRQLQETLIPGIPKLRRSEVESACEDFSNVVGTSSFGTVYKGTLPSRIEIAVISVVALSSKDWSSHHQAHFRSKIDSLSEMNHRNFINLVGYCEDEEPFTRMLVFEYAPNGTLFEHLHIKEAEHLDWGMRIRIAMGIAYCLEHMHQLTPPMYHNNLTASSINLTEDYAAKISDFGGSWDQMEAPTQMMRISNSESSNVYSFGVLLFEMITGRLPYSVGRGSTDWASDYLTIDLPLAEMMDPMLTAFRVEELEEIVDIIGHCVDPDPDQRPSMVQVCSRLRVITGIGPDAAAPKVSPPWAELEIMSTEAG